MRVKSPWPDFQRTFRKDKEAKTLNKSIYKTKIKGWSKSKWEELNCADSLC